MVWEKFVDMITQAHMHGQICAGVKEPSFSDAMAFFIHKINKRHVINCSCGNIIVVEENAYGRTCRTDGLRFYEKDDSTNGASCLFRCPKCVEPVYFDSEERLKKGSE